MKRMEMKVMMMKWKIWRMTITDEHFVISLKYVPQLVLKIIYMIFMILVCVYFCPG